MSRPSPEAINAAMETLRQAIGTEDYTVEQIASMSDAELAEAGIDADRMHAIAAKAGSVHRE